MEKNNSKIAVLFDLEDTLVQTPWEDPQHVLEFRQETRRKLVELGISFGVLEGIERATLMRNKASEYITEHFNQAEIERFQREMETFLKQYELDSADKSKLFPDTIETLNQIKKLKIKMGLVTNTSKEAVNIVFKRHKLEKYFDTVITRENVEKLKPDSEGILLAIKKLDADFFFMIGDLIHDAIAARNANGIAIIVKRSTEDKFDFPADYFVHSLSEIPAIIQEAAKKLQKRRQKMLGIAKIDESNKQHMIDLMKTDIMRHVFAFYDLQYEPENTTMYAALEDNRLKGYILIYIGIDFPSAILECDKEDVAKLIEYTPKEKFIMHTQPNLLQAVKNKFPYAKHYVENWMLTKKGESHPFKSELIRRLCTEEDASGLATLLSTREERPKKSKRAYMEWIKKMPLYGVFVKDELIAYAGSFIQLPQIWMIGGVYTHPNHRNKGYATLATSAVTEEALKNAEAAALFVRSDNYPAIKAYEKIGYKKIGEKLWIDVGTGLRP